MYDKLLTLKNELNGKKPFWQKKQGVSVSQPYARNSAETYIRAIFS